MTTTPRKKRTEAEQIHSPVSEYFGELTFGLGQMREKLPRSAYVELLKSLEQGKKLSAETAEEVAQVIREWAVSKGTTHFCHWFQPMTGLTAEKHDAFISIQHANHSELKVIERFKASPMLQASQAAACALLLKPAVTPPGILRAPFLSSRANLVKPSASLACF
jgi:glutamine synthetase